MSNRQEDTPRMKNLTVHQKSSAREISSFLKTAGKTDPTRSGRLVFALDATMSRQPTWDRAMKIQTSMFDAVGTAGGLAVQLVFFRGFGECRASKWVINGAALRDLMAAIDCRGGHTQLLKVLSHVQRETQKTRVAALVYIGDALEEDVDQLCQKSGELGLLGVRCFFFQEGGDVMVERAFREMARLTRGAYFRLGPDSARELAELLSAIAIYVKGGLPALAGSTRQEARRLLAQISG
ncbi:MAG: VWA domain-containing protein [Desulfofustis sp.]|nr:VWA domain-containing protein [Desulfofustis sp.]